MPFVAAILAVAAGESDHLPAAHWESGEMIFLRLLAIFALVVLNGLFVASELAIVKIRSSQLEALIERNVALLSTGKDDPRYADIGDE